MNTDRAEEQAAPNARKVRVAVVASIYAMVNKREITAQFAEELIPLVEQYGGTGEALETAMNELMTKDLAKGKS